MVNEETAAATSSVELHRDGRRMFAGMIVLGLLGEWRRSRWAAVPLSFAEMLWLWSSLAWLTMTISMVAWMCYRGILTWQPSLETAASMMIPTLAAIVPPRTSWSFGALMGLEHVATPGTLVATPLRLDEYTSHATTHTT